MSSLRTRLATPADAAAITAIYNEGIARSRGDVRDRAADAGARSPPQLADKGDRFPTVVAERDGQRDRVGGRGRLPEPSRLRGRRRALRVRGARGAGHRRRAGRRWRRSADAYAERGFWKIVSRIFPENTAQPAPCTSGAASGWSACTQRHGKLDGEWRDCVIVERLL